MFNKAPWNASLDFSYTNPDEFILRLPPIAGMVSMKVHALPLTVEGFTRAIDLLRRHQELIKTPVHKAKLPSIGELKARAQARSMYKCEHCGRMFSQAKATQTFCSISCRDSYRAA